MNFVADYCYHYKNLRDADRKSSYVTPENQTHYLCNDILVEGWYRFVGTAGTKMPTTGVPSLRCVTKLSGWLGGAHPTVEDGEVYRTVCFSNNYKIFKFSANIFIKKTVHPTSSTNLISYQIVLCATVPQTDFEANVLHVIGFINKSLTSSS